uniref:Uncharacterized protein n=1 Tax=Romanomermis culicivorax TaxID=13658 RepID=A0A915HV40_ROMCU
MAAPAYAASYKPKMDVQKSTIKVYPGDPESLTLDYNFGDQAAPANGHTFRNSNARRNGNGNGDTCTPGNLVTGIFGFFVLFSAGGLLITSLFTHHWIEETFETGGNIFSYQMTHGLYEICSKKFVMGQRIQFLPSVNENPEQFKRAWDTYYGYTCTNRFESDCKDSECQLIETMLKDKRQSNSHWEIICLSLMCVSCGLTILILFLYAFLYVKFPSLLAFFTLAGACCSCALLITFSSYYATSTFMTPRDNDILFRAMLSKTNYYGFSFWLACGGSALQFFAFLLLALQVISMFMTKVRFIND